MSRSPCVAATSLKNFLPINNKDFKSPNRLRLSPVPPAHSTQYRTTLSPFPQCNAQFSSLSPSQFPTSPNTSLQPHRDCVSISVDSPHRLLFASKIKSSITSSNLLGRGRFGQVVLAKYKGADVAVKIVKNAAKQQMVNEINGELLSHKNIINIIKIEKLEEDVLILMEPWGSINLQQLLSMSLKIPWEDVIRQLSLALDYCHSQGVLHLDVKPANVMVNSQKWIKLGDFGNSVSLQQLELFKYQQRVGTVSYCAPEILRGNTPSVKSDVYSFGITMWQFQHNQVPFSELSWPTIAYLVVAKDERPNLPMNIVVEKADFVRLYRQCWLPNPGDRPAMFEIVNILRNMNTNV